MDQKTLSKVVNPTCTVANSVYYTVLHFRPVNDKQRTSTGKMSTNFIRLPEILLRTWLENLSKNSRANVGDISQTAEKIWSKL